MRRLALTALMALSLAAPAWSAQVSTLIAEKAAAETGAAMPAEGSFEVQLSPGGPEEAKLVSAFWMDRATGQFAANVLTDQGETWRVTGLATLMVTVPVPVRRLLPGAIVTKDDLTGQSLPYQRVSSFAVMNGSRLVGMQVKRVLAAGRPVQSQSVAPPVVVGQGDRVLIEYRKGRMRLSVPGRAITSAQADQEVRVINLVSNRTVTGIARSAGLVEVQP